MHENENQMMSHEEELVNVLLDFIIVSANLAKRINHALKQQQIKEGVNEDGKNQRTGYRDQRSQNHIRHH